MSKKKPHAVIATMQEAQERIATAIASSLERDALTAYATLISIMKTGDVNGERRQAATKLLDMAGVFGDGASTKTKVTAEQAKDGGKITVEVVHIEKPHAEDD